ncbi:MAG: ACT domain-containing protein [Candidatus Firestonebacteria bacterium]|nr:ACT domain-containing protein [Candidatus Firestonebacteria bacterium]
MPILKQLSVFVQNQPGKIERLTSILAENNINILAFNIASSGEYGVIKIIADKPELAYKKYKEAGLTAYLSEVLGIKMQDKPGGLHDAAKIIAKNSLNVENAYVYVPKSRKSAMLVIDVRDVKAAKKNIAFGKKQKSK